MSNRRGRGFWSGLLIFLVGVVTACAIWVGYVSQWFRDWTFFTGPKEEQGENYEPPKDVTDGDGNELTSGIEYELPQNMVFARMSAQSETASEGIMVSVKIFPITATERGIKWKLSANPTSEWIQSLPEETTLNDFISLEPDSNDSTKARVKCLAPFGAQIVITATSESNPDAFAECRLDYAQRLEGLELSFGNVEGAMVNVALSSDAEQKGGMPDLQLKKSSVYTVTDNYTVTYSLSGRDANGQLYVTCKQEEGGIHSGLVFAETKKKEGASGLVTFEDCVQEDTVPQNVDSIIKTKGLYFSVPWLMENMGMHFYHVYDNGSPNFGDQTNLGGIPVSELTRRFDANYNGPNMSIPQPIFKLTVTVHGTYSKLVEETVYFMIGYVQVIPNDIQIVTPSDKEIIF